MECPRVQRAHKCSGAEGRVLCPEIVHEGSEQQSNLSEDRQLYCSGLSGQLGRNSFPSVAPYSTGDMELVRDRTSLSSSSACSREKQCRRRHGISCNEGSERLENRLDCHHASNQRMPNRSICFSPNSSAGQICQLATRSGSHPYKYVHNGLDEFDRIRIPSIQHEFQQFFTKPRKRRQH